MAQRRRRYGDGEKTQVAKVGFFFFAPATPPRQADRLMVGGGGQFFRSERQTNRMVTRADRKTSQRWAVQCSFILIKYTSTVEYLLLLSLSINTV